MLVGYYQKIKKGFKERLLKGIKIFVKKENKKSVGMLASDREMIFFGYVRLFLDKYVKLVLR